MTLPMLRDDALRATADGFELALSLPWIRSLPMESLQGITVRVDGNEVSAAPTSRRGWWHLQDRVPVHAPQPLSPGAHDVELSFTLAVPYLAAGPDGPLVLPFRERRSLTLQPGDAAVAALPDGWTLTASAFNWTPDVIDARRSAADLAVEIVRGGVAEAIEIEAGQSWRSYPQPLDAEVDALRDALAAAGGRVSIVGASIDDWTADGRRRTDEERLAFLVPQLRAAARVGAIGARVPLGQAGPNLLRLVQPTLHELDIVLFEEAQGQQTPMAAATAYDAIAALDDPHIRVLLDISMLMPALPVTYLDMLRRGGIPEELMHRLEHAWREPETHAAVIALLRSGRVPAPVHTLFMNLLVRFGRTDAAELRGILPLVSGVHLKFWDLDDADGRVSAPIRAVAHELRAAGFTGTLCSEWGGNEWLDDDAAAMTRAHLALARPLLAEG